MSRITEALSRVDLDAHAQSWGFRSASDRLFYLRLRSHLMQGGTISEALAQQAASRSGRSPAEMREVARAINELPNPRIRLNYLDFEFARAVGVDPDRFSQRMSVDAAGLRESELS